MSREITDCIIYYDYCKFFIVIKQYHKRSVIKHLNLMKILAVFLVFGENDFTWELIKKKPKKKKIKKNK